MKIREFKGNFFEIGKQQGKIYKKNGMDFSKVEINHDLYKDQLKIYKQHYPEIVEEFEGVAKGGEFNKDKLIYSFITDELFYYRKLFNLKAACTIFGVKRGDDLFVGRNLDWIPITEKVFEVYKVIIPKRNSFIAVSDMAIVSPATADSKYLFYCPIDTINNKGLFVGITFAYADQWSYGLSFMHLMRLIAEKCSTVNEALGVFDKVPLCCPKNFFIADKNGEMAVVEHTTKNFKIIRPKDNVLIQTNHYVDNELAKEDTVLKRIPTHNTYIRYFETLQKINMHKGKFKYEDILKILCRPGSYTYQNFPGIKTIWSLALDMTNQNYDIYWDLFKKRKTKKLII